LREDARAGDANTPTDHLAEPWAVPLQEARLSSFLAALPDGTGGTGNTVDDDKLAQHVLLSGAISDLQGRLNVTNLLQGEQLDAKTALAFERLFDLVGVPPAQLSLLTQGLIAAQKQNSSAPLMPQRIKTERTRHAAFAGSPPTSTLRESSNVPICSRPGTEP
jgi:general secretion pathway protein K